MPTNTITTADCPPTVDLDRLLRGRFTEARIGFPGRTRWVDAPVVRSRLELLAVARAMTSPSKTPGSRERPATNRLGLLDGACRGRGRGSSHHSHSQQQRIYRHSPIGRGKARFPQAIQRAQDASVRLSEPSTSFGKSAGVGWALYSTLTIRAFSAMWQSR